MTLIAIRQTISGADPEVVFELCVRVDHHPASVASVVEKWTDATDAGWSIEVRQLRQSPENGLTQLTNQPPAGPPDAAASVGFPPVGGETQGTDAKPPRHVSRPDAIAGRQPRRSSGGPASQEGYPPTEAAGTTTKVTTTAAERLAEELAGARAELAYLSAEVATMQDLLAASDAADRSLRDALAETHHNLEPFGLEARERRRPMFDRLTDLSIRHGKDRGRRRELVRQQRSAQRQVDYLEAKQRKAKRNV